MRGSAVVRGSGRGLVRFFVAMFSRGAIAATVVVIEGRSLRGRNVGRVLRLDFPCLSFLNKLALPFLFCCHKRRVLQGDLGLDSRRLIVDWGVAELFRSNEEIRELNRVFGGANAVVFRVLGKEDGAELARVVDFRAVIPSSAEICVTEGNGAEIRSTAVRTYFGVKLDELGDLGNVDRSMYGAVWFPDQVNGWREAGELRVVDTL